MSSIFSKGGGAQPTPVAPTPTPPPTMPDPFDPAGLAAQQKAREAAMNAAGRSSTILTTAASRAPQTIAGAVGSSKLGAG